MKNRLHSKFHGKKFVNQRLGLKSFTEWNKAAIEKLIVDPFKPNKSLWADWIWKNKILKERFWCMESNPKDTQVWRCLLQIRALIGPASCCAQHLFPMGAGTYQCALTDQRGNYGSRYTVKLQHDLPTDLLCWQYNQKTIYSMRGGYLALMSGGTPCHGLLWHQAAVPRQSLCAWRLLHQRLASQDILNKRGTHVATTCCICKREEQTLEHLFVKYDAASWLWKSCY